MKTGDRIRHDRFGSGTLAQVSGDKIRIDFDDGSDRAFSFAIARAHLRTDAIRPKAAKTRNLRMPRVAPVALPPGDRHCNQCGKNWRSTIRKPKVCRNCGSRHWNDPKRDAVAVHKSVGDERRKFWPTPAIDAAISEAYADFIEKNDRGAIGRVWKKLKWPKWAVLRRAGVLGLARVKEPRWTEDELAVLRKYAHLTPDRIARHMRTLGFQRSRTAVNLKIKRLNLRANLDGYSMYKLSLAFGIDSHAIAAWIERGLLKAELKGTNRKDRQGGDSYWIRHRDVKAFVFAHPEEVDLRKVEKMWFLGLLTDGAISDEAKAAGATA